MTVLLSTNKSTIRNEGNYHNCSVWTYIINTVVHAGVWYGMI